MAGLKQIKSKIRSVGKTGKVTKAMEAVSAVKMRKGQQMAITARPYALAALHILRRTSTSSDVARHPLLRTREKVRRLAVLLITSDKGLAGALNSAVLKAVREELGRLHLPKDHVDFYCIGRKGKDHFEKRGHAVIAYHENASDSAVLSDVRRVTDALAARFEKGEYDRCLIGYQSFVSTFEQRPTVRTLLPISEKELDAVVSGILPSRGKFADVRKVSEPSILYTLEPDPEQVLRELLPDLLNIQIYHSLLESKASEHSARMVAMKSASDKARDLGKELTLDFNKARQAAITREVSEIIGGIEAMQNSH